MIGPIVAQVLISTAARELDREFSYLVPEDMMCSVQPGMRVIVPFGKGNKPVEGFIMDLGPAGDSGFQAGDVSGLKEIKKLLDDQPILYPGMIELAKWMKKRYLCTLYECLKLLLPPGAGVTASRIVSVTPIGIASLRENSISDERIKKILEKIIEAGQAADYAELKNSCRITGFSDIIDQLEETGLVKTSEKYCSSVREKTVRAATLAVDADQVRQEMDEGKFHSIQQIRVLEILMENPYVTVADLTRFANVSASVLNTLRKHGYIEFEDIEVKRDPLKGREIVPTEPFLPTPEQQVALDAITRKMDEGAFAEILLHGVTGSGKTEVYLQAISRCIDKGRTAIVLVPEISLTPQMMERFRSRFGNRVSILHSRLSLGERYDQWRDIWGKRTPVVVGARSAVFAPLENIGLIIVDEEHEYTYKSEMSPRYHAIEVARQRCRLENAVLLLGSATPSVESYFRALKGEILLRQMHTRTNHKSLPDVELVDMRSELESGNRSIFSRRLREEIEKNLANNEQTILFLNRRGYSTFVLCRSCGLTMKCPRCEVAMTYHQSEGRLICHYCGYTVRNPETCPRCGSKAIRYFGTGTQKVEEELKKLYPQSTIIRMDIDTVGLKNSHEEILNKFQRENINILIGTQMIAKGHDFPNVTLVGVLAADSLLGLDDFRASERTFQLITQVSGRSGRSRLPGRTIVQTYNTDDFSIQAAKNHDYHGFYSKEILLREKLGFPPFKSLVSVLFTGAVEKDVAAAAGRFAALLDNKLGQSGREAVDILGPARAPMYKIRKRYRWRLVLKTTDLDGLLPVLEQVQDEFISGERNRKSGNYKNAYGKTEGAGVTVGIDVNPLNML